MNTGLRVFTKVTERDQVFYRTSEEGLGFIDRFFTKRIVALPPSEFLRVLTSGQDHVAFAELSDATQAALEALEIGPSVAQLDRDSTNTEPVVFNMWVGKNALLPRVSKNMRLEVERSLSQ